MSYGVPDPQTGQTYYGRGFVQLTWRDNYARADAEIPLIDEDSVEWHAHYALDPPIAGYIMFIGMIQGWFRSGETLPRYFSDTDNDPYGAREIINGVSIGNLIADYHRAFYDAFAAAWQSP